MSEVIHCCPECRFTAPKFYFMNGLTIVGTGTMVRCPLCRTLLSFTDNRLEHGVALEVTLLDVLKRRKLE